MKKDNIAAAKNFVVNFWNDNKSKIKFGAKCVGAGLVIGFIKGMTYENHYLADLASSIVEKIPDPIDTDSFPSYETIEGYVRDLYPEDLESLKSVIEDELSHVS